MSGSLLFMEPSIYSNIIPIPKQGFASESLGSDELSAQLLYSKRHRSQCTQFQLKYEFFSSPTQDIQVSTRCILWSILGRGDLASRLLDNRISFLMCSYFTCGSLSSRQTVAQSQFCSTTTRQQGSQGGYLCSPCTPKTASNKNDETLPSTH